MCIRDRGHTVAPDQVLLTASTSEAYQYLFKLLGDTEDEVLVPRPSYPLFEFLATLESLRAVSYPLVYDGGWSIDRDALAAAVTGLTRAIVLVNPNNPTGSFLKRDELRFLRSLGLTLISDAVSYTHLLQIFRKVNSVLANCNTSGLIS